MANVGMIPTITPVMSTIIVAIALCRRIVKKSFPPASPR
jgi:hypothetical protein